LNENASYVFFREIDATAAGPLGSLGVPLTGERSIAVDTRFIPLGSIVFLSTTYPNALIPLNRLMFAQDTGGAIRGVVRADFYWGTGLKAGEQAGRMKQNAQMWVLWPKGTVPPL
jgi:membrane-bound lytic murein transglycosylase A